MTEAFSCWVLFDIDVMWHSTMKIGKKATLNFFLSPKETKQYVIYIGRSKVKIALNFFSQCIALYRSFLQFHFVLLPIAGRFIQPRIDIAL